FNNNGTTTNVQVMNGKTVQKPQDPSRNNYWFVGWYTDNTYKNVFSFSEPIFGDRTLYANFVEKYDPEFNVKFDANYAGAAAIEATTTKGGKLYELPQPQRAGYTFAGWWVSQYEDATKLAYKYTDQALYEDTTLYAVWTNNTSAPVVSVTDKEISWVANGINNRYTVRVKLGNEVIASATQGTTAYAFDFTRQAAGDYTVEVELNGQTGKAYYRNKGLDRVSYIDVVGNTLVFNSVANAQKYAIEIACGDGNHTVEVTRPEYDFSNCEMKQGGITFTVTAMGDGYLSSTSKPYTFERTLKNISNLRVNNSTEMVTWNAVENATAYNVTVLVGGNEVYSGTVTGTSFELKEFTSGAITVKVVATARGWNPTNVAQTTYNKTRLAAPTNIHMEGYTLKWDAVAGATGYEVKIGNDVKQAEAAELVLNENEYAAGATLEISVRAIAANAANNSLYSNTVRVQSGTIADTLTYEAGVVAWDAGFGVQSYVVRVNGEEVATVTDATNYAVTLTRKGENKIEVCAIGMDGARSQWVSIEVIAYAVAFDTQKGDAAVPTQYKAKGDPITLPEAARTGYTLEAWYTEANGNGTRYGAAGEVVVFENAYDTMYYAAWNPNRYNVTLMIVGAGGNDTEFASIEVEYGKEYFLPRPASTDATKAFAGWYREPNGQNTRYTNYDGSSISAWKETEGRVLYAFYAEIFNFEKIESGYAVSKGPGISYVQEITIPQVYEGIPITTVEDFSSCSSLRVVNIPDTIQLISLAGTNVGFRSCTNLTRVNIIETQGNHDRFYESVDGVLIRNNMVANRKELAYFPQARTGEYTIPNGVQVLPSNVFQFADKITKFYIPETVTLIESQAFYTAALVEEIVFLPTTEGATPQPLTIRAQAFQNCTVLEKITFPSRLEEFASDAFTGCSMLTAINVEGTGGKYTSHEGFLCIDLGAAGLELVIATLGIPSELKIPVGITSIGNSAFTGHAGIEKLIVPGHVTNIGNEAFKNCANLREVVFEGTESDLDLTIGESAFYNCDGLTFLTLPANLVGMGVNAFGGTNNLLTVNVESGAGNRTLNFAAGSFGSTASYTYLTVVNLGKNVPAIDIGAVFGTKLKEVHVDPANPNYYEEDGVLFNKAVTNIFYYPVAKEGAYVIPETVTTIGENVFFGRTELTKITIGKNVQMIEANAFKNCDKLAEVVFTPGSELPLFIGDSAFNDCDGLAKIEFPARTREIGASAFASSAMLATVIIPEGVKAIGASAFSNAIITSIHLPATLETLGGPSAHLMNVFANCSQLSTITVAAESNYFTVIDGVLYGKTEGKVTDLIFAPLKSGGTNGVVNVPGTVTYIWDNVFYNNTNIREIRFAALEGTLEIGDSAFSYCSALEKVNLPAGLATIGAKTFQRCDALKEIFIPNTVTSIAVNAFYYCEALKTVTFEAGNLETPLVLESSKTASGASTEGVFYYCTSLEEITLPERTTQIGTGAFARCTSLETINIPSTVVAIADYAFYELPVKNVNFAEGSVLTEIGSNVFAYTKLENIKLPAGLKTIGASAFYRCENLHEIKLPEGLETISRDAFAYNHLTEITIPSTVTTLGTPKVGSAAASGYVFWNSPTLEKVTFADNCQVTELYGSTFSYCPKLTTVDFGKNSALKTIGNDFGKNVSIKGITIPANVTSIAAAAFEGNVAMTSVTFEGTNVTSIGNTAFARTGLTKFEFPESTSAITLGTYLFQGCGALEEVYLSSAVASIANVFTGCVSIKVIKVSPENRNFKADETLPVLYNAAGDAVRFVFGSVEENVKIIKDGVTEIGDGAFFGNTDLVYVYIPKSVTKIGANAFRNCLNLQTVEFEEGSQLTTIGGHAFQECRALKEINIPASVTTFHTDGYTFQGDIALKKVSFGDNTNVTYLPQYMFADCTALTEVQLPTSLTRIRHYAFMNTGLVEVDFSNLTKLVDIGGNATSTTAVTATAVSYAFQNCEKLTKVTFPSTTVRAGTRMFEGCTSLKEVNFGGLTMLGSYFFAGCTALESITIPASVTTVSTYVFQKCTNLKSVEFEEGSKVAALGNYMFDACSALTTVVLPNTINHLGTYTFRNCTALKSIDLSNTKLTRFSTGATTNVAASTSTYLFLGCESLEEVILPAGFIQIGAYTFQNCTSLKSIDLTNIKVIANYAFQNCGFESLTIPASFTSSSNLGSYAFAGNTKLKSVTLTSGIKYLGVRMFQDCTALESIELPASLTSIGTYTFVGCTGLKSVKFEDNFGLKNLPTYMFQGCASLTSVDFGNTAFTQLGNYFFQGCTALESIKLPDSLTFIGTYSFANTGLKSIDLSNTQITSFRASATGAPSATVNAYVFNGCENLTSVTLPANFQAFGAYSFFGCTKLTSIDLGAATIIGNYAFANTGLTGIYIPRTVTTIGTAAFGGNVALESISIALDNAAFRVNDGVLYTAEGTLVTFPAGKVVEGGVYTVEEGIAIGQGAFYGCTFDEIILPEGITMIADYAFYYTNIAKITIPETVYQFGNYVFSYSAFESVRIPANAESVGNYTFQNSEIEEITILTPNLVYYNYATNGSGPYASNSLFQNCYNLRVVNLPEGMETIGSNWFQNTTSLESIKIPSTVTAINSNAFLNSGLTSVHIPASVKTIGLGAFAQAMNLKTLTFEEGEEPLTITAGSGSLTAPTNGAFQDTGLETVVLPKRLTTLPGAIFRNNVNLTSVTLPDTLTIIGEYAFYGCTALKGIELPNSLLSISTSAFGYSGLVSIEIPDSVATDTLISTEFYNYVFEYCTSLVSVKLSKNLQSMGNGVFRGCTALTDLKLPESLSKVATSQFEGCTSLKLVIPKSVTAVTGSPFAGFTADQTIYFEATEAEIYAWWTVMNTKSNWYTDCNAKFVFGYTGENA
ncbi:MAG: leucine-rich repeat protein, partial [Clostridia bacterium]|nr:leucine-rich repeat protein [Clostridia bacterium]